MRKSNRAMMVKNIVDTLTDSVREYEAFEQEHGHGPLYNDLDMYHNKESIKRRITQARAELNQLAKDL